MEAAKSELVQAGHRVKAIERGYLDRADHH